MCYVHYCILHYWKKKLWRAFLGFHKILSWKFQLPCAVVCMLFDCTHSLSWCRWLWFYPRTAKTVMMPSRKFAVLKTQVRLCAGVGVWPPQENSYLVNQGKIMIVKQMFISFDRSAVFKSTVLLSPLHMQLATLYWLHFVLEIAVTISRSPHEARC